MARGVAHGDDQGQPVHRHRSASSAAVEEMLFVTRDEVRAVAEAIDPHYRVLV